MPRTIRIHTGWPEPSYATLTARPVRRPDEHDVLLAAVAAWPDGAFAAELAHELAVDRRREPLRPHLRFTGLPVSAYEIRDVDEQLLGLCVRPGEMRGRTGWIRAGEWLAFAPDGSRQRVRTGWLETLQSAAELLAKRPRRALRARTKKAMWAEHYAQVAAGQFAEDADAFADLPEMP
ncbi:MULTISPECIES: hypothetical protein [Methylobacterium]|uniref:hypothetical protein n=1 Tax=Methylobacterium TaxID=407 RepID=UPI002F2C20DE